MRHYRQWESRLDVVMRQEFRAGEKVFLDFAGPTVPITDPEIGMLRQAQLFVAVLAHFTGVGAGVIAKLKGTHPKAGTIA